MKKKAKPYWKHGSQIRFAEFAETTLTSINDVLHRRCGVSYHRALRLSDAAISLKKRIPWTELLNNRTSKHPAFYGKPHKIKR